ncbi:MAG: methyltransferase [Deltaproteobacteria bacterium]|nr:methyltransferase [Deltaproteobacteria bacterium]
MCAPGPHSHTNESPPVILLQMMTGYWGSQAIYVAAKLGLADLLKDGPKSGAELAQATRTHAPSLTRLLRALASIGVLAESEDGRFELTPLGACLQSGVPGSVRAAAIMFGETLYRAWSGLLQSVQTGETAFGHVFGTPIYQYFAQHPEAAAVFNEAMIEMTTQVAAAVVAAYDFSRFGKLVDVGGGYGTLVAAILQATPTLSGVVLDRPQVAEGARKYIEAAGLAGRCAVVGGDFFESVPSGGDAYVLKSIIHAWDDDRSIRILTNCYRVMAGEGPLLLVERVLPARTSHSSAAQAVTLNDLNMLVTSGGHERTEAEFRALFTAAGFTLTRIIATQAPMGFSVIEGVRVDL